MTKINWLTMHKASYGSDFERLFAENVLSIVSEIDFNSVSVQFPFQDMDGKQRYCDFVIMEKGGIRIAIEIDGYDKRGTGTGMSHDDFVDWQRRQAALVSQGWFVLRFANRDVRDCPARCAEHVSLLLRREREKINSKDLSPDESRRLDALTAAQSEINILNKETSIMKYTIMSFTVLIGVLILALAFKGNDFTTASVHNNHVMAAATTSLGATCDKPLDWRDASKNVGQTAAIAGPIMRVTYKEDVKGKPTWIEVGATYPNSSRLVLVVWGQNRDMLNKLFSQNLEGKNVCVIGTVEQYKGVPQVELKLSSQVQLVN